MIEKERQTSLPFFFILDPDLNHLHLHRELIILMFSYNEDLLK